MALRRRVLGAWRSPSNVEVERRAVQRTYKALYPSRVRSNRLLGRVAAFEPNHDAGAEGREPRYRPIEERKHGAERCQRPRRRIRPGCFEDPRHGQKRGAGRKEQNLYRITCGTKAPKSNKQHVRDRAGDANSNADANVDSRTKLSDGKGCEEPGKTAAPDPECGTPRGIAPASAALARIIGTVSVHDRPNVEVERRAVQRTYEALYPSRDRSNRLLEVIVDA